jgi:integrase
LKQDSESDLWFFDIGTEGGRAIKTVSSRRKVPVHAHLVKIGRIRYRQSLIDGGMMPAGDLWPDVKSDAQGRRAGPWSKWFNRYLKEAAKVDDAAKVFHSFRHTFKRLARDVGINEELHDALTGHSGGGVGRSYGGGFGLKALAEALNRIEVPAP